MELTVQQAADELGLEIWTVKRVCREHAIGRVIQTPRLRLIPPADLARIAKLASARKVGRPISIKSSQNGTQKTAAKKASRRKSLSRKQKKKRQNA